MRGTSDRPRRGRRHLPGRRRYWAIAAEPGADRLWLDLEETHHVLDVMRHRPGDRLELIDGSGRWFTVALEPRDRRTGRLSARVLEVHAEEPEARAPWLVQAVIRPARLEALLDGAVQTGVRGIVLFTAARSPWSGGLGAGRQERLLRVMRAATAQALALRLPKLRGPLPFAELKRELAGFTVWVAHGPDAAGGSLAASDLLQGPVSGCEEALVVGPEGGLTDEEVGALVAGGGRLLDLGPQRLRAETAAIAGLTLLAARLRQPE